jgi:hypothetical protein
MLLQRAARPLWLLLPGRTSRLPFGFGDGGAGELDPERVGVALLVAQIELRQQLVESLE